MEAHLGYAIKLTKKQKKETGEIAQWLRALAILPEDWGLVPSTRMVAHNQL